MFDETNENKNVNENQGENESLTVNEAQDAAEEKTETVNPYAADEPESPQSVPVSPIPEEPSKKFSNKVVIGVIAGAVSLFLIIVLALIFGGIFKDNKQTVADALRATFTESGDYINNIWNLEQYEGMFEDEIYTIDAQMDLPEGMGIDMVIQKSEDAYGVYAEGSMAGVSLAGIQMYIDDIELAAALPGMVDYVFTINRETFADDIQNMVDMGLLDQESADEIAALNKESEEEALSDEAYEKFLGDILKACVSFADACEMEKGESKKLTVDGKEVSCKGYVMVIDGESMADFSENIKAAYQENEECLEAAWEIIYESVGVGMTYDLEEFYDALDELAQEYRDSEQVMEMEFYLYDGRVAQIYLEADDGQYLEWYIEGGNFPLENTNIVMGDESETLFEIRRTGSNDSKYRAEYEFGDEYDTYIIDLKYSAEKGDFSVELSEKLYDYDYSVLYVKGSFEKSDDSTIEIDIDSLDIEEETILSGNMTIENTCDSVERPVGEEKELLLLSEEEWEEILWEIVMSMY